MIQVTMNGNKSASKGTSNTSQVWRSDKGLSPADKRTAAPLEISRRDVLDNLR
jgi:hypothetical protein